MSEEEAKNTPATEKDAVKRTTPGYYGRVPYYSKAPYYGPSPYYGANGFPTTAYGGAAPYYYGGAPAGADEESLIGAITLTRIMRVCMQRWVTIMVFIILGAIGSFFVFKLSPTIYEAKSIIEMSIRPPRILPGRGAMVEGDAVGSLEEVFNTRLARLRSRAMMEQVLQRYHSDYPNSAVPEDELIRTLSGKSDMKLQRRSRLVVLSVRSHDAQLAADLANSYALTAETFTQEENKLVSEEAVAWLRTTVEAQRRRLAQADQAIMDFKVGARVDSMVKEQEGVSMALARVNTEIADLESRITLAEEMLRTLQLLQDSPDRFGSLPENTPRASEISATHQQLQQNIAARNALLARYTDKHPDVLVKEKEVMVYREQFAEVVKRSCETAQANCDLLKSQMEPFRVKRAELSAAYADLQTKIDAAVIRLHQLQRDLQVNEQSYKALLNRMEEARLAHDENMCTVKIGETSSIPRLPISPKPTLIFPAGPMIGLLIGILFVLVVDHFEDKITGISDIEQRLRMKVLCVLPRLPIKLREELAVVVARDKFSHFSEAFAGLRNLLDSPRYQDQTKVILVVSTQPGEGKTVTATNLGLTYAASGQKTLVVDFDLRRPRQARIFKKKGQEYNSLPHTLVKNDPSLFETLPIPSDYDNLDIVLTRASSEISPATLVGNGAVGKFFEWARENYDRVIIDSPPFGIVGDAVVLANMADSVMLMCCPDRTHFGPLKHAIRHLSESGARVIGVVVNDVDFLRRSSFSGYDYHYRYAYNYGGKYGYRGGHYKPLLANVTEDEAATAETGAAPANNQPARHRRDVMVAAEEND